MKTKDKIVNEIHEKKSLISRVEKWKMKLLGHIMLMHNNFIKNIIERKVTGKITRGRPRTSIMDSIYEKLNIDKYVELWTMAMDRTFCLQ